MKDVIKNAKITHSLTKDEIIKILSTNDFDNLLYSVANDVREKYKGDEVYLRALIEFSNICSNNCFYCGIRAKNTTIHRYTLSRTQITDIAKFAIDQGFKTIVLQSGEADVFSDEEMTEIISEIKKSDVALTLSIGEKTFEQYKKYKDAGADRYLLRIETTDESLYAQMHPNMSLNNRIRCLKDLKTLGYEVGTGCLVGLPNQTLKSLADDMLFFKEIDADMIGIGAFIATESTPLANYPNGSFELARKIIALVRILVPDINIPATTAMETIMKNGRMIVLQSGANVVMPNFTPNDEREKYSIYKDKSGILFEDIKKLEDELKSIDRKISNSKGFRR